MGLIAGKNRKTECYTFSTSDNPPDIQKLYVLSPFFTKSNVNGNKNVNDFVWFYPKKIGWPISEHFTSMEKKEPSYVGVPGPTVING